MFVPTQPLGASSLAYFAPGGSVSDSGNTREILVTCGQRAEFRFDSQAPTGHGAPETERWYTGGRAMIHQVRRTTSGWADLGPIAGLYGDFLEFIGACRIELEDGTCRLWYSARPAGGAWRILATESRDGGETWGPVCAAIYPGSGSDREHTMLPCVVRESNRWLMYYVGRDGYHRRIHRAISRDGWSWTKEGIVIDRGQPGECDEYAADCPSVARLDDCYFMVYGAGSSRSLAAAISKDGIQWRKLGPILDRRETGMPDSEYAFYPWLIRTATGFDLLYAGEDSEGRWSILEVEYLDVAKIIEKPLETEVDPSGISRLADVIGDVPREYMCEPPDAHSIAPSFTSADGLVRQLRPSSTPVFAVEGLAGTQVIKLGRSPIHVRREHAMARQLAAYLPVVPAALRYLGGRPVLVMPWVPGVPAGRLAVTEPERFVAVVSDYLRRLAALAADTLQHALDDDLDWSLQTPDLLLSWLDSIETDANAWADSELVFNDCFLGTKLRTELASARAELRCRPEWSALGTGDNHLNNILVGPGQYNVIDFEFAGRLDLDFTVSKILASCLKHASLLVGAAAEDRDNRLSITAALSGEAARLLLGSDTFARAFDGLPVNWIRVRAYVLAKLRFRFAPSPEAAAHALAALAVTHKLTESERRMAGKE